MMSRNQSVPVPSTSRLPAALNDSPVLVSRPPPVGSVWHAVQARPVWYENSGVAARRPANGATASRTNDRKSVE